MIIQGFWSNRTYFYGKKDFEILEMINELDISLSHLVIYIVQIALLPSQVIAHFSKSLDKKRLRFLYLSIAFLLFNSIWLFSKSIFGDLWIGRDLLAYSGIFLSVYGRHYFSLELGVPQEVIHRSSRNLLISLFVLQLGHEITMCFVATASHLWVNLSTVILFQLISFLFVIKDVKFFVAKIESRKPVFFVAIITLILATFIPVTLFLLNVDWLKPIVVNISFFSIAFVYFRYSIEQSIIESNILSTLGISPSKTLNEDHMKIQDLFVQYELTNRERQIALQLLQGLSFEDIASKNYISDKTVKRHAYNIYPKVGVSNLDEFLEKFKGRL